MTTIQVTKTGRGGLTVLQALSGIPGMGKCAVKGCVEEARIPVTISGTTLHSHVGHGGGYSADGWICEKHFEEVEHD